MSEDLMIDHLKLVSPSILTKNSFLPGHWGEGLGPLVYASEHSSPRSPTVHVHTTECVTSVAILQ